MPPPPQFHNVDFGLRTDSLWPPWLYVDLYAFQPHALRNRWKGRVLAGGMVIVLDLFLAIHVIYFLRRYVRTCVRFSCIYVTYLDPVPLVATDPSPGSVPANGCRLLQHRAVGVFFPCLHHVRDFYFVFVFLFFCSSQVSRVLCWGLMEMFGRWFWKRNECRRCCSPAAPSLSSLVP